MQKRLEPVKIHLCPPEYALNPWLTTKCLAKTDQPECSDMQADLSFRWTHIQSCRKCCAPANLFVLINTFMPSYPYNIDPDLAYSVDPDLAV